ncbi:MAG: RNA polymerase sigma factor [Sphingomonadaceae bacterium]|nr:RNA polymerase sigma factor [Sphingomonadaceae bacterium]
MTNEALLAAIAAGNRQAFDQLYRQMYPALVAQCLAILGQDLPLAEDAVDEAFVDIWRRANTFDGRGSASGWIRRIARNKAIDLLRKLPAGEALSDPGELVSWRDESPGPEDAALCADQDRHVLALLDCLSADHREVVVLHYYSNMRLGEIAEATGTAEGTVKSRLFHARKLLRERLERRGIGVAG